MGRKTEVSRRDFMRAGCCTAASFALGATLGREFYLIAESDLNDPRVIRPREALGYLTASLYPDQRTGAIDLAGDLGCLPLGLALATAVIRSPATATA